jgi:hypothetical protein
MARLDWWQVKRAGGLGRELLRLGFRPALLPWGEMNAHFRPPLDVEGMARIARGLIALGVPFSAGREWSPSEVVEDLRDRGLVDGPFQEIAWTGADWRLRAR